MAEKPYRNKVLSDLNKRDLALLEPLLEEADLPLRKSLEKRGKPIKAIYFPESGFASVVADSGKPIEVGLIGREGMTGLPVVLGNDRNSNDVYMQAAGNGYCIPAKDLRKAIAKSVTLHAVMLRYVHAFLEQATRTAVANGRSKIEERLARWLLMASDRIDGPSLPLTHEFLAMMLGVQRTGVTVALLVLQRAGVITHRRGAISIKDRSALEKLTYGIYTSADYS